MILQLGTNDVTRNKDNPDNVILSITSTIDKVQEVYTNSRVTVSSILPRYGKGPNIDKANSTTKQINNFIQKFCARRNCQFIDNDRLFLENDKPTPDLFDQKKDGVHVSDKGAQTLMAVFMDCVHDTNKLA